MANFVIIHTIPPQSLDYMDFTQQFSITRHNISHSQGHKQTAVITHPNIYTIYSYIHICIYTPVYVQLHMYNGVVKLKTAR